MCNQPLFAFYGVNANEVKCVRLVKPSVICDLPAKQDAMVCILRNWDVNFKGILLSGRHSFISRNYLIPVSDVGVFSDRANDLDIYRDKLARHPALILNHEARLSVSGLAHFTECKKSTIGDCQLLKHQISLSLDNLQRAVSGSNAEPPNDYKRASEGRSCNCADYHPSIHQLFAIVFGLFFGGLLVLMWDAEHIDNHRCARIWLCVSGFACAEGALLFLVLWIFHPFTWGLPAQWLPAKWNPCPQDCCDYFPHGQTVTQKHYLISGVRVVCLRSVLPKGCLLCTLLNADDSGWWKVVDEAKSNFVRPIAVVPVSYDPVGVKVADTVLDIGNLLLGQGPVWGQESLNQDFILRNQNTAMQLIQRSIF